MQKLVLNLMLLLTCPIWINSILAEQPPMFLEYDRPATVWMTSALPIGNGSLGAMFFGGVEKEEIQFNEKTLWEGGTNQRGAYQNFGNLYLNFSSHDNPTEYSRTLSLDEAIGNVNYKIDGIEYQREYFVSNTDNVMVLRITTPNATEKLNLTITIKDAHQANPTFSDNKIRIRGKLTTVYYEAQVMVLNEGGNLISESNQIDISDADAVTILLTAATNYDISSTTYVSETETAQSIHERLEKYLKEASSKSFEELKERHLSDYQPKFERVKLDFDVTRPNITTDLLVRHYKTHPYLDMLFFQFGRYLMLSSAREGALPSNLQGIWNDNNDPAWQCDIHSNINVQMNYWPAENTNLSECHLTFLDYIRTEALKENGSWSKMGLSESSKGWTVKTQNNIFGYSDWNWNRPANAWYCMHFWQHYRYTNDIEFLENQAYPVLKSACEFWLGRLKQDNTGQWIAPNEWSPEHGPWEDGIAYAQQLIWELFDNTLKAIEILGTETDFEFINALTDRFENLDKGLAIDGYGQIREWKIQENDETNDHRHLSHLIALYPGNQISYHIDPAFADAAKATLNARGDGGTGWSRTWKISCWARLFDSERAYKLLKEALNLTYVTSISMDDKAGGIYENLFDAHPSFQIDGNFGLTAGIAEMLIQSNLGFLQLLPALPQAWTNGSFEGLKGIGNFTIDLKWKNSSPTECLLHSLSGNECKIYFPNININTITDEDGNKIDYIQENENLIRFDTEENKKYIIYFNSESNHIHIIPHIQVNDNDKEQTSSVVITEGELLTLLPECDLDGEWEWNGPNDFFHSEKELSFEDIKFAHSGNYTVNLTSGDIKLSHIYSITVIHSVKTYFNQLPEGEYYIKKRDTDLYWTNTQITPSGTNPGGKPQLYSLNRAENPDAQIWKVTFDSYVYAYKLVNKADGRYINEKGDFGVNDYYSDWNALNIYHDDELNCGVQITGNSASYDGGAFFWEWASSEAVQYSNHTTLNPAIDLIFTFIPYQPEGINTPTTSICKIWGSKNTLHIQTEDFITISLYNQLGILLSKFSINDSANYPLTSGIYIIKAENKFTTETIKIIVQ